MWVVKRDGKTIFSGTYAECSAFMKGAPFPAWQMHLKLKAFVTVSLN